MINRRKVGTILDEELLREAKVAAASEGIPLNILLAKALRTYLDRRAAGDSRGIVAAGWGAIPINRELLRQVLDEEDSLLEA